MKNLDCKYLGSCGSCVLNTSYEEQMEFKFNSIKELFSEFYDGEFEFFDSGITGFRSRAEFGIYHDEQGISYSMRGSKVKFIKIDECKIVDPKIAALMPKLLEYVSQKDELKTKLFGVEFITTKDEILVILLYHKNVELIKSELENLSLNLGLNLIARSFKKKLVFGSSNLNEELIIYDKSYFYTFGDGAFIQPNRSVNQKMISWALGCANDGADLLELYCGHGNFTIPLSFKFSKVLATEVSKASIANAMKNCELNGVNNIKFTRLSAEELMQAFNGVREFNRLKDTCLKDYNFSHILVDPPRAGCDDSVLEFMKDYENIIYISCNPLTLKENLKTICKTHKVIKFAMFDQFVHTNHIECGVLLKKLAK
ncbi:tRNA m5U54 methyltransferase [Campylobacter iguaniorum]|uniref:tRNA m5U54 methyltransferase n=1 Tax=Campylobacter iguaniorum TaxID=1244531 RepID=A0A076FFX7_9BACT|nr:tRNA (uridine(54)-C5)-methyltransferase TrmA [Campylobacter iguaniorum]AII14729.1 tRNA m5U54 methyltransferase [Campylobacter iguaniorum]